jgi:hypothetical protein
MMTAIVTISMIWMLRLPAICWSACREEAARHYDEPQLAALVVSIATINAWNCLMVATWQVSAWRPTPPARSRGA